MIAALEVYDENVISRIVRTPEISGVVLGDLFCNQRMFAYGTAEMEDCMKQVKKAGKKVYFQTPCYMTDAIFGQTVQNICYWWKKKMIDGVLVQDVGLLKSLYCEVPEMIYIWSFMGVARNGAVNLLHYQFLRSLAPVIIATDKPAHSKIMREYGIPAILMYGRIGYATVNRLCYFMYENNIYDHQCKRQCLKGNQHMVNERFHQDMTVDGYLLGKKYVYRDGKTTWEEQKESGYPLLLYAKDYEHCMEQIDTLRKETESKEI